MITVCFCFLNKFGTTCEVVQFPPKIIVCSPVASLLILEGEDIRSSPPRYAVSPAYFSHHNSQPNPDSVELEEDSSYVALRYRPWASNQPARVTKER